MRNTIITLAGAIGLLTLFSCNKETEKTYISANPTTPVLSGPQAPGGLIFTKDEADSTIDFSWSASDFGFQASVTYGVQMAKTSDFLTKATILTSQGESGSAKINDINNVLVSWNLQPGSTDTVWCRVFATVSAHADTAYSQAKAYTVTPFESLVDYPVIYVPGEYQGWSPGLDTGRLFSYNFDNKYQGIIRMMDTNGDNIVEFKVTPAPNWDLAWGGTLTNGSGTLDPSGGNYSIEPGTYSFDVDVSALTIKLTATDDWGIIGSSIPPYDWSVDVNMFYDGQRKMWEITGDFKAGEFKFRANDAWDLNYGSPNADGTLTAGGDNIPLPEDGNYTIRLDTDALTYQIIKN